MGKRIRCYLVFASPFYRVVMFLLVPVLLVGSMLWLRNAVGDKGIAGNLGPALLMMALLSFAEIFSDTWLFGGIQAKDTINTDYLKTSGEGMGILRKALPLDFLRKFLSAAGISAVYYLAVLYGDGDFAGGFAWGERTAVLPGAYAPAGGGLWWAGVLFFPAAVSWFFSVLGTFLTRFADTFWANMMVGNGAVILVSLSWRFPGVWKYIWGYDILFLLLGFIGSVAAVKAAMKKVEGSYYD